MYLKEKQYKIAMILLCPVQGPWASSFFLHFTCENPWKMIRNFRGNITPADGRDVISSGNFVYRQVTVISAKRSSFDPENLSGK